MSNSNGANAAGGRAAMPPLEQILRRRRILLTGATGFLGKVYLYLLLRWHPELDRIYLLIRGDRRLAQSRFRREILDSPVMGPLREHLGERFERYVEEKLAVVCGDITEPELVSEGEAPGRGELDAVVHCAGLVNFEASLEKSLAVNTTGVANVIEFCRKRGVALLHVSTCYAAGDADGHRYEDDKPIDWSPNGRRNFNLRREIRDALAAIARVEAESHDQARHADAPHAVADTEGDGAHDAHEAAAERWRKRWVEERLKEVGLARARRWGWPNTYSYSKSLGEQLVFAAARDGLRATVVRPSVIESALADPFPGWNQGVNTSAPLTYLSGRGYRFYPARSELVLDVLPVDLAAHAMIPILAALLIDRHKPIYQLCTSDVNPLPMRRLVELSALSNRREHRRVGGPMGRLAPHLEAVVVSQSTYDLVSRTLPALLKQGAGAARQLLGESSERARRLEQRIEQLSANTEMARGLVEVYRPYIQELVYTFHGSNIRALYKSLAPADAERHPYAPERIDWADYWINVHLPGLRRHIFGSLDLHTRGRPSAPARHRTLAELLERAAERYGSRPALVARHPSGERVTTTFRELRDGAHRAGLLLGMRGVKPGDRVLLIGENSPEWVLAYFSIIAAGAVAVPLDHLISPDELASICRIAAPSAALCSATVARRLDGALGQVVRGIVELEFAELTRPFVLKGRPQTPPAPERRTLASIVFTSGTTGAPKGVMLTQGNFAAEVAMLARVFSLEPTDVVLSLLPLHHTFEFTCGMLLPLALGATIVYPLGVDAASLARTLADVRPTALIGVPALWEAVHRRIVDGVEARGPFFHALFDRLRELNRGLDREWGLNLGGLLFRQAHTALGGRLRLAVSGGAALPQRIASFFNDIGIRLLEGYGLTEAAPVLSVARPDEALAPGSVGKPLNGVEIRLDSNGDGRLGEILARGPNVMAGYYRNQAATDEVLRDGWLRTGDLGRLDDEGRLYIVGRAKEVIVDSGGNNIYIDELEEAYGHSPYVKELAIVGLKVAQGEQAAALVVPAYARGESRRSVEDKLRAHFEKVGNGLSPHKRIRILRFTDAELPRTRTRKVRRSEVAAILERMLQSHAQERAAVSAEVEPWLAQALAQVSIGADTITPATRLIEDLGLDSLALAELAEHIAAHAGRELSPEELADLRTVDDLQRVVGQEKNRPRLPSYAKFAEPFTPALPGPLRRLGEAAFRSARRLAFDGWLRPRVLGAGNVPANRNFLVVANHASHLDFALVTYALGAAGRDLVVLAAKDYFFNTSARRFVFSNFTRLIPFDRERAQLDSLDDALAELAAGHSVLMFPEGTRSPDGAIHEFKSGAGYLALRSGCDVLPIRISGTHEVLGKGAIIPHRHPVEVRIGRVLSNAEVRALADNGEGAGAYRKLADAMRAAVLRLGERMPAEVARVGAARKPATSVNGAAAGAHPSGPAEAANADAAPQAPADTPQPNTGAHTLAEPRNGNRNRRGAARAGRRAKG
ncbi:MAG TPA: AMP-binding protein [Candidatus Binataceae bacterium]|nr:AMP-binding protein [Candidatus Binataceae bacterium]